MNAHQLPGRLRLRYSQLKRDLPRLMRIIESLRTIPGVVSIEATPRTGGMLIHYQRDQAASPVFWDTIQAVLMSNGIGLAPWPLDQPDAHAPCRPLGAQPQGTIPALTDTLAERLGNVVIDKMIDASVRSLVTLL